MRSRKPGNSHRLPGTGRWLGGLAVVLALGGCATSSGPAAGNPSPEVACRADSARVALLEQEVARLNGDLRSAEQTLVAAESGLRGKQTRAEAVSRIAEARIEVDHAAKQAPWQAATTHDAREKLDEADRQLAADHIGSAIFFASRASRMAQDVLAEAETAARTPGARYVAADRVNLRAAPDRTSDVRAVLAEDLPVFPESRQGDWVLVRTVAGDVGWVHESLLRSP
jgi:hypothetical protein